MFVAPNSPGRMRSAKEESMGRPITAEPRDRQLNISLTATEYESLVQRARAVGMRPAYFGRSLLLDRREKNIDKEQADSASRLIFSQLVRLGNNLNQMVRHLHRTGDPLPADLEPLLNDIRQTIARGAR